MQTAAASHSSPGNFEAVSSQTIWIDAKPAGFYEGLKGLWHYRELLYFLAWRDVKLRYKQTLLGAAWAVIQPLFAMLLFTFFFGRLAHLPSDNIPYPLFAYAGLLPWTFFANAVTNSSQSLVGSATLITKVYFPRVIIPAAPVLAGLIDLAIAFALLVPLFVYYRVALTWQLLLLPLFVILVTLLAIGIGMAVAALNVRYRDVRYALPFLVQLWMFASPVIYPTSIMPAKWKWLLVINPLTGIIEGFRSALFGKAFDWPVIASSGVVSLVFVFASAYFFRRVEDSFADVV